MVELSKYQELAADIIDLVCERMAEEYDLEPKPRKDDGGDEVEDPAHLFGADYYSLEDEVAEMIRKFDRKLKDEQIKAELMEDIEYEQEYIGSFNSEPAN